MANVLVLGATGYVGGRLVPRLLKKGHRVRCLVRNRSRVSGKTWKAGVEVFEGDTLKADTLPPAFENIEAVYYLIHSMGSKEHSFEELDRISASNVAAAAELAGVKLIVFLGALGSRDDRQSAHLSSRHETGDVLRQGSVPVTELRAAVVVGSGSISFEMIHHLVNRLPVMICPRWVYTRTQPIAIHDVLEYLIRSLDTPRAWGRSIDIGGPQVLTYRSMMFTVARELGLRRYLIPVPVLTPRLSSYWVNLVTPVPARIARPLIDGLRHETICENDDARRMFDFEPLTLEEAVRRALARVRSAQVETAWIDASPHTEQSDIDPSHLRVDRRSVETEAPASVMFDTVSAIGGDTGWYYADWLWKLRGFVDQQLGGVGLRRGRRHPTEIAVGDALDFWRVEQYVKNQKLTLRAEMRVWGRAWLEFEVEDLGTGRSRLVQTARYYPRGLWGLVYWYGVYPLHALVFKGMAAAIARAAAGKNTRTGRSG